MRFPWTIIRGWNVSSLANGNILIEPDYIQPPIEDGCAPVGLFTRLRLALWVSDRLVKRRAAGQQPESIQVGTDNAR